MAPRRHLPDVMYINEAESRLRARELSIAIDSAVDRLMTQRGVPIPGDTMGAVMARAVFLDGLTGIEVGDQGLRATYTALRAALGEMGAEPHPLNPEYVRQAQLFLKVVRSL